MDEHDEPGEIEDWSDDYIVGLAFALADVLAYRRDYGPNPDGPDLETLAAHVETMRQAVAAMQGEERDSARR